MLLNVDPANRNAFSVFLQLRNRAYSLKVGFSPGQSPQSLSFLLFLFTLPSSRGVVWGGVNLLFS